MPIYEALCTSCGNIEEYMVAIEYRDESPCCPKCGELTERKLSPPGSVWAPTSGGMR